VAVRSGRFTQGVPLGHTVRRATVPQAAVDAMFSQAGVIQVDTLEAMLDVAQLLSLQPLPRGARVAIVGNSDALQILAADAAVEAGLALVGDPVAVGPDAPADRVVHALREALDDAQVDAVVLVYVAGLALTDDHAGAALAEAARRSAKPVVATVLGAARTIGSLHVRDDDGVLARGSVPAYASPDAAVRALAKVAEYATWRARPSGTVPELDHVDVDRARSVVGELVARHPDGLELDAPTSRALLAAYGIEVWPAEPVASVDDAVAAGERLGWDVVLKATAPHWRQRPDLADVWRNIDGAADMRDAWATMTETIGAPADAVFVVQKMAPPGVPVVVGCLEDPLFGPMVTFGVAGVATDLLGDLAYRIPPLTDTEAAAMVRTVRAAPMLFGHRGGDHVDVAAIEDVLHRVSRLAYDVPEVTSAELVPVLAGPSGVAVLGAVVRVAPVAAPTRTDWFVRRLARH